MAIVATGAKAVVGILSSDNAFVPVAFASSIDITHDLLLEEIPQLDDIQLAELAENGHRVAFSVGLFKLIGLDSTSYSLDNPRQDDTLERYLIQPELIFQVIDETVEDENDRVLYEIKGCKFNGGTGRVDARGIWQGTWKFKGRRGIGI